MGPGAEGICELDELKPSVLVDDRGRKGCLRETNGYLLVWVCS